LFLELSDGSVILDASGGPAVVVLGHGNERVAQAIGRQAAQLAYTHTVFFANAPAEALAQLILGDAPGGLTHAFFVSSGSEATESALKLARQYFVELGQPQRTRFISRQLSYHGNTLGALSVSGHRARRALYEPLLHTNHSQVSPCFRYRYAKPAETDADYAARLAAELAAEFERVGPQNVAAFIAEPVVGAAAGCVTAVPGYFKAVRDVCDRYGALLILDEVMCGMGRTGTTHAWEQEGIVPDIQTVAKGLGGGYAPIGGIFISGRVVAALTDGSGMFVHGHTYQAHPVACAAALEVQRIIAEERLVSNVRSMGRYLERGLKSEFATHAHVGDIRGRGLFWALEFVKDKTTRESFDPKLQIAEVVKDRGLECGLAVYPCAGCVDGERGDQIIISPPFNVTGTDIDMIIDRLASTLKSTFPT
jgi:adenosylmethionine-8-amino-7-oxononanoate aminotransferase